MIGDNRQHFAVYGIYFSLLCLLSDAPGFCAKAAQNAAVSVQGRKEKVPSVETCGIVWGIRLRSSVQALLHLTRNISVMVQARRGP